MKYRGFGIPEDLEGETEAEREADCKAMEM